MGNRLELHEKLCSILGTRNVYFQPPESIHMHYPCIVYEKNKIETKKADNKIYKMIDRYSIKYITKNIDDTLYYEILKSFEMCSFDRYYRADGLNHFVLTLYY